MIDFFSISDEGIQKQTYSGNWLALANPSNQEKEQVNQHYDLPENFFRLNEKYPNVSFFENKLNHEKNCCLMLLVVIQSADEPESMSSTMTIFLTPDLLITVGGKPFIDQAVNDFGSTIQTKAALILRTLQIINEQYLIFLQEQRKTIEEISQGTSNGSNRNILEMATHTEKKLVFIDNLLKEQSVTINQLLASSLVTSDQNLALEIELQTKQATTSVQIYREMLSSISGLIDSMMDNRLNQLMKFLNTASLLLALPTLIFSLWGINTGGLLWRDSELGSFMVVLVALIVSIISGIYLFKKDYDA